MGLDVNICVLLVGLGAFAGWTLYSFTAPRRAGWVNLFGGIGILALFFSIVSPEDDGFQQELIRPATPSVRVSAQTRLAARRSPSDLAINAFVKAGNPIRVPRIGRLLVMDQPFEHDTCFHGPFPIHSPPVAS
jgi:hypothetical protein